MLSSLARRIGAVEQVAFVGLPAIALFLCALSGQAALRGAKAEDALSREGFEMLARHKWAEAAVVLRSSFHKSPGSYPVAVGLANSLLYSGRRSEAVEVLSEAAAKQRGSKRASLIRRERVLSRLFLTNQTFSSYQDGVNLLLEQKPKSAREKLEKALEFEPHNVDILTRLGQSQVLLGDYDSAAEHLREARRLNPYEPEVSLWLGRALHQRGELEAALEQLGSAAAELKNSELAALWQADALWSEGNTSSALEVLERDSTDHPFHVGTLLALSRYRAGLASRDPSEKSDLPNKKALWEARKDLQIALSRIPAYFSTGNANFEDLGLDLRSTPSELETRAKKLLQQVEDKLETLDSGNTEN